MTQNGVIVQCTGIHKTYDTGQIQVHALRGVELSVNRGKMVAIMGPPGCGKTTLLNCLSGLDSVDRGEVIIEGTSLAEMSDDERTVYRAQRMGFVFQFYNLLPVLSAVANVELPLLVSGVKAGESRRLRPFAGSGHKTAESFRQVAAGSAHRHRLPVA